MNEITEVRGKLESFKPYYKWNTFNTERKTVEIEIDNQF